MSVPRIRLVARFSLRAPRLSPYVLSSLAVHVAAVVLLIVLSSLRHRPALAETPLIVDLVAAPAGPATVAPPPAAPSPPPEPPAGAHLKTGPVKPSPAKIEPAKDKKPEKKKEKEDVARRAPKPEPAARPPAPAESAGDATGSITPLAGDDVEFAWYRASLTAAVYSHWRKPILEGAPQPYEVRVVFDILRDGGIRGLHVERSSGVPSLDRSALRAVSDAVPLPPLPPTWRESVLPAGFVFRLHAE